MKKFYCRIFVPCTGKYEYFREINFLETKNISKFIQNKDIQGLSCFFQDLANKNSYKKDINFNILDYLAILCQLRGYCYGSNATFSMKNENGSPFSFKHNVQRLLGFESLFSKDFQKNFYENNIEIKLNLPENLIISDENDLISTNVEYICIDSQKIFFKNLDKKGRESVLNVLPASFSNKILNYIQENTEFLSQFQFFEQINSKNFNNISLNPYNNSVMEYLKTIFNYDLMSLYELEYLLIRKLKFSLSDLREISLNEAELHLNLYKKELKTLEESSNKSGVAKPNTQDN